ncbi:astakine-like [Dreissena polymorpha]|uniref:Uncharacterized protein n=1 Tax=Dreissena polymorpha TaxID=45954 RepID=A0A9D4MBL9_DREPO|nr:astakine-like [Dreissena polymorpha]KAH3873261.1 hypothetical protein DPMN_036492 [Dreissena polymorpha]
MIVTTLLIVVVLFSGASAILVPGSGALTGYCITSEHCKANECCVSFDQLRGRRDAGYLSPELKQIVKGKCEPLGRRGATCYVTPLAQETGRYYNACPCSKGLYCRETTIPPTVPLGPQGKCTANKG